MAKKEEKNKVGRPKLADSKTKKESIFICIFTIVVITIVAILGYNILTIDFNPKYNVGSIYNTHVSSCIIEDKKIDCGPNVTYMKYKLDNEGWIEVSKQDKSIEVALDNNKKVEFCYKTDKTDIKCNK